ncbi:GDSL-type esterase/lipase family protein [Streptomyces sp. GTA36]
MKHLTVRHRLAALFTGALLLGAALSPSASASAQAPAPATWTGTWATAPTTVPKTDTTTFNDQTIRQIVHTSIAGTALRIRLSNEFGKQPLKIGEVHVARRAQGTDEPTIDPATDRELTFSGKSSVTIPAGAPALSDPVTLRVPARSDLVVSLHLPESTPQSTVNSFAAQRSYVAAGNVTGETKIEPQSVTERWYFLTGVSVRATSAGPAATGKASAAVALGDSITADTTLGTNHRWTDYLAQRLQGPGGPRHPVGVLNKGISGNRLLHDPNPPAGHPAEAYAAYFGESGLKRFDRDVTAQPGVRHVLVLLGVNDLGHPGNIAPALREGDRPGPDRRPPAAHRPRPRARTADLRSHHHALQERHPRLLHARERGGAPDLQPLAAHERRVRRCDRFRRRAARPGRSRATPRRLRQRRPPAHQRRGPGGDGTGGAAALLQVIPGVTLARPLPRSVGPG